MKILRLNELIAEGKTVKGRWELGPYHELIYRSLENSKDIKLQGPLVAVEPDALVFSMTEKEADGKTVTHLAKLQGTWKSNARNQIVFSVERQSGRNDELTLTGSWHVARSHELIYDYETIQLKTKKKVKHSLTLKGVWDITDKSSIVYLVGGNSESMIRFRGAYQTKSILAKKGEIRYQVGVGLNSQPSRNKLTQSISLFGKWKYSDQVGLFFEVDYARGQKQTIIFGGDYALSGDSAVEVSLKTRQEEPLGIEVILTKEIFKNAETFLRFQKSLGDTRVEVGVQGRW